MVILFLFAVLGFAQTNECATLAFDWPQGATNVCVYFGQAPGAYQECAGTTNGWVTLRGLAPRVQYFAAATGTDSNGVESAESNEVSFSLTNTHLVVVQWNDGTNWLDTPYSVGVNTAWPQSPKRFFRASWTTNSVSIVESMEPSGPWTAVVTDWVTNANGQEWRVSIK